MINRRKFIQGAGAITAALATPLPLLAKAAKDSRLPSRPIPGTGEPLPVVGLGNSAAFQSGNLELTRQLLDIFTKKGGAYVDTAGSGRFTVRQVMNDMNAQDRLFLGTYITAIGEKAGAEEISKVRAAQNGNPLDLLLSRNVTDMTNHPDKFRRWQEEGLTRHLGVARSNKSFYESMMKFINDGLVDFVQVNYSLLETEAEERVLPMAMDKGIAVIINRPFMNGEYFSFVQGKPLPEWAAEFDCHTWAQFSLKFILSHPAVNCVLTETANPEHVIENLCAGIGGLPDQKTRRRMIEVLRNLANQRQA